MHQKDSRAIACRFWLVYNYSRLEKLPSFLSQFWSSIIIDAFEKKCSNVKKYQGNLCQWLAASIIKWSGWKNYQGKKLFNLGTSSTHHHHRHNHHHCDSIVFECNVAADYNNPLSSSFNLPPDVKLAQPASKRGKQSQKNDDDADEYDGDGDGGGDGGGDG